MPSDAHVLRGTRGGGRRGRGLDRWFAGHARRAFDPRARIDWNLYAQILERFEALHGDELPPEEIGRRLARAPSFDFLRRAGQLVLTPQQLYEVGFRLLVPSLFANLSVRTEWLASGRFVIDGELTRGSRPSNAFFRICAGNLSMVPCLLDLPPATIEELVLSGTASRIVLVPPPSHTLARRVLRGVRALGAMGDAWRQIARQQREIEESLVILRSSRHELQQLIERLPDGVLIQHRGTVRWANEALLEIVGARDLDQVVGRPVLDFVPPEDREALVSARRHAATGEVGRTRHEYRLLRVDGGLRRVQSASVQSVNFRGQASRLVVLRDVTEQHRIREQAAISERLASIGALGASVAHEINNPLAYVRLSIEVAAREAARSADHHAPSELHTSLVRAAEGTERVLGIVRDLKMLTRSDDACESVDVLVVLDAALALAQKRHRDEGAPRSQLRAGPAVLANRGKLGKSSSIS